MSPTRPDSEDPDAGGPRRLPPFRFYQITDRRLVGQERMVAILGDLFRAGLRGLQIREKDLGAAELLDLTDAILRVAPREACVLVNDRADVALARALGVHRPESGLPTAELRRLLGPEAWIGVSCHDLAGCRRAQEEGADFVTLSPVFASPGKGPPLGLEAFREIVQQVTIPVFALGGITPERVRPCLEAGAYGVAAISATLGAEDPVAVATRFARSLGD
jgi:thiamine-phosphate pyrophosphorylase